MSNAAQTNADSRPNRDTRARRVLVIAHSYAGETLPARLTGAGYEVRAVRAERASQAVAEFAPHVALVEAEAGAGGEAQLEFASRLRVARATAALPLVLLFDVTDANLRAEAQRLGADDFFALSTPPAEIRARLDALFWRAEAGRRAASLAALERRAEIDGFLQLLDAVRTDIEEGTTGALALIAAAAEGEDMRAPDASHENRALAVVHEFFKLNLRRADSIAFYGPTLLLAYLPRKTRASAQADLARLSDEFLATREEEEAHGSVTLQTGLAAFPADGTEIESLIEQAEAELQASRPPRTESVESASGGAGETSPAQTTTRRSASDDNADAAPTPPASFAPRGITATAESAPEAGSVRHAPFNPSPSRAVRESKQTDMDASVLPAGGAGGAGGIGQGTLAQEAADAAARERERRARGHVMPRRLLLTVSDPARMAQINLLLRSAGYEVRAAFDGLQAINLLRIERPDLLVIDDALYGIDGLEALRRLHRQHHERLPLPVVLLLSNDGGAAARERVREEARGLGARGFVALPYDPEELLTCVRTVGSTD
ncbi:MAG TPA: response regulator [Pyrinomonadaceae bacterium]|nr:response regulator [Pyrinomonadaceae bacterium]